MMEIGIIDNTETQLKDILKQSIKNRDIKVIR